MENPETPVKSRKISILKELNDNDKSTFCLPRQDRKNRGKWLKNRGFEGMRENFHLETTFFGFGGGKSGLISIEYGESRG